MAKQQDSYVSRGVKLGLNAKLALRRHFLRAYHADGDIRVLDCCQAKGEIWGELRREFQVKSYWGVDKEKRLSGRLVLDSARILQQSGLEQNVIDIDTYGSPWKHWFALLENAKTDLTVFLTFGRHKFGGGFDSAMLDALGLRFHKLALPDGVAAKVTTSRGILCCLAKARDHGFEIVDAREAEPISILPGEIGKSRHARYFGIRIVRSVAH